MTETGKPWFDLVERGGCGSVLGRIYNGTLLAVTGEILFDDNDVTCPHCGNVRRWFRDPLGQRLDPSNIPPFLADWRERCKAAREEERAPLVVD